MCDECTVIIAQEEHIVLPNKYQCEECASKFTTKTLFKKHKHCRFDESYLRFVCDICIEMWTEEEPLEQHMHQKHEKQICVRCNSTFEGKENLNKHYRAEHRAF